jgi:hypothetical protein
MEIQAAEESPSWTESQPAQKTTLGEDGNPLVTVEATDETDIQKSISTPPAQKKKSRLKGHFRLRSSNKDDSTKNEKIVPAMAALSIPIRSNSEHARKVMFEVQEESRKKGATKEIENLCAAISEARGQTAWRGILTAQNNISQEIRIATDRYFTSETANIVSLADLLSTPLWNIKNRCKLCLRLASTVLQLYQTPWLGDNWGKEDIFFIQEKNGNVLLDKPFLRPRFPAATAGTQMVPAASTINVNVPSLFALGVVLIELHFKKPIDELQKENNNSVFNPNEVCLPQEFLQTPHV